MKKILYVFVLYIIFLNPGFYSCKTPEVIHTKKVQEFGSLTVHAEGKTFVTKEFAGRLTIDSVNNRSRFRLQTNKFNLKFNGVMDEFRFGLLADGLNHNPLLSSFDFDYGEPFCYDSKEIRAKYPLYPVKGFVKFYDYIPLNHGIFIISGEFNIEVAKKRYPVNPETFYPDEDNFKYYDNLNVIGKFDSIRCVFHYGYSSYME